ncbi:MAG: peptidase [Oscillospiraceae bacterium]|nr:peptidase [Oscillospiraceae bacterium]
MDELLIPSNRTAKMKHEEQADPPARESTQAGKSSPLGRFGDRVHQITAGLMGSDSPLGRLGGKVHQIAAGLTGSNSPLGRFGGKVHRTVAGLVPDALRREGRTKDKASVSAGMEELIGSVEHAAVSLRTVARKPAVIPVFLLIASLCIAGGVFQTVYTTGYQVTVNGTKMGVVSDSASVETVVQAVEDRASAILGYDYTVDADIQFNRVVVEKTKLSSSVSGLDTYLFSQIGEVMKRYVITVDGVVVGALDSQSQYDELLDQIASAYVDENTKSYSFSEDIEVNYDYVSASVLQDYDQIKTLLTSSRVEAATYVVQEGDTYYDIAYENSMSLSDLMALNPQADIDSLHPDDVLNLNASVPYVTVNTVENVSYTENIACPVEEVDDASMYVGDSKVVTQGVEGQAEVNADVNYVNGVETTRTVLTYTVTSEPTTQVVAVGTTERPTWVATGSFRWPVSGNITSYFGYRSIFGSYSYHSGIDIATSYGTAIAAADGGTVVWSGYKGSYGNLVIIDHGNGYKSYYGHCSSLLVSVGDKVYKGQTIARVGSTGRSTGNHCHFEVRYNDSAVNPLNYLP